MNYCEMEVLTRDGEYADSTPCGRFAVSECPECGKPLCAYHAEACCELKPRMSAKCLHNAEAANLCVEHAEICPTCGQPFCETCFADHQAECAKPVRMYEGRTISNLLEMVNRRFKE